METFLKVRAVEALPQKRLRVVFSDGTVKTYDCVPLMDDPAFLPLLDDAFFRNVHPDAHGFGVVWNDEIDLAESELWMHGTTPETPDVPSAKP